MPVGDREAESSIPRFQGTHRRPVVGIGPESLRRWGIIALAKGPPTPASISINSIAEVGYRLS